MSLPGMSMTMYDRAQMADDYYMLSTSTKSTEPRDIWKDSILWWPKKPMVVLGFDGFEVHRCQYDVEKKKWYGLDGKAMMVFMWRRQ
jgi:hypothetical protein